MKKQKNVHLELMKFPKDKFEIAQWQRDYPDTEGFKNIRKYILEDNIYTNLMEVIELNHETFAIGEEEQKLALVAKLPDDTIIAWILLDIYNLDTPAPGMFLQYFCMHIKLLHECGTNGCQLQLIAFLRVFLPYTLPFVLHRKFLVCEIL